MNLQNAAYYSLIKYYSLNAAYYSFNATMRCLDASTLWMYQTEGPDGRTLDERPTEGRWGHPCHAPFQKKSSSSRGKKREKMPA